MIYDFFTNKKILLKIKGKIIVIGNSGNIFNNNYGEIINNFNVIVRLNNAPISSYEKFIGSRTDIRICAHNAISNLHHNLLNNLKILIVWGTDTHLSNNNFNLLLNIKKKYPTLKIYKLRDDYLNYNYNLFNKYTGKIRNKMTWLSTGWFSIFFAKMICNNVYVHGFGFTDNNNICNYHYYDNKNGSQINYYNKNKNKMGHKFYIESFVFSNLIKNNIINKI
tara:strand:- start:16 stop:681 length:666 start_codon:yes stop_codon:yes gene_type:complete